MWAQFFDMIAGAANNSIDLAWHSIWIGTVLVLCCWLVTRFVRNLTTANRYNIWFSVLIIIVALPLMTGIAAKVTIPDLSTLWQTDSRPLTLEMDNSPVQALNDSKEVRQKNLTTSSGSVKNDQPDAEPQNEIPQKSSRETRAESKVMASNTNDSKSADYWTLANTLLPIYAMIVWVGVAFFLLVRLLYGYLVLNSIKKNALPFDPRIDRYFQSLVRKMQIKRKVYLCQSSEVNMPMAAGYISSRVIIPRGLVSQLTNSELQDILLHELAHIKRYDDVGKLFQRLFEAIFFFNPIIRIVGNHLAFEREIACDDTVVRMTNRPQDYARCLTRLVEIASGPRFALAPGAMLSRNQLFRRFDMILNSSRSTLGRVSRLVLASSLALIVTIGAACLVISPAMAFSPGGMSYLELSQLINERLSSPPDTPEEAVEITPVTEPEIYLTDEAIEEAAEQPTQIDKSAVIKTEPKPERTASEPKTIAAPEYAELDQGAQDVVWSPDYVGIGNNNSNDNQYAQQNRKGGHDDAIRRFERSVSGKFSGNVTTNTDNGWTYYHNLGRRKIIIEVDGKYEISDDLQSIKPVGNGSSITIEERFRSQSTELYLALDRNGNEEIEYYVDGDSAKYNDNGKDWLADLLLFVTTNSGMWTDKHVALLLKEGGVDRVLMTIGGFDSDYTKRMYYQELLLQAKLTDAQLGQILGAVERDIDSDYEKAELLIALSREYKVDRLQGKEFVDAVRSLDSDYETRRVLSEMAFDDSVKPGVVLVVLDIAREMSSDYERAELLLDLADISRKDAKARQAYYKAVEEISSDYETRRVLSGLGMAKNISDDEMRELLLISSHMSSDNEKAEFLMELADTKAMDAKSLNLIIDEIASISSDYEKCRVLRSLKFSETPGDEYVEKALKVSHEVSSDYERARLLSEMIDLIKDRPALHLTWLDAAGEIASDYEMANLLSSFVRRVEMGEPITLEAISLSARISSDYDKARMLKQLEKHIGENAKLEAAFKDAVESISSDYEREQFSVGRGRSRSGSY